MSRNKQETAHEETPAATIKPLIESDRQEELVAEQYEDDVTSRIKYDFASDWRVVYQNKNKAALEDYINKEIQACIDGDYKVLSSILQLNAVSEVVPRTIALIQLRQNFAAEFSGVALVLVPENLRTQGIPHHDYNGCLLPAAKRGKVLSAKVTFRGEKDISSHGEGETPELVRSLKYSVQAFNAAHDQAKRIYNSKTAPYYCVEIGDKPKFFTLDDAVSIMERYGYGVAKSRVGKQGLWLVTEA